MIHTFTSLHYVTGELYFYSFFFFDESDNSFPLSRLPRFSESFAPHAAALPSCQQTCPHSCWTAESPGLSASAWLVRTSIVYALALVCSCVRVQSATLF